MTLKSLGCIKSFEDSWPSTFTYIPSLPYFGDLVKSFIKLPWGISKEPIFYGDPKFFFQSPIFLVSRYFFITFFVVNLWNITSCFPFYWQDLYCNDNSTLFNGKNWAILRKLQIETFPICRHYSKIFAVGKKDYTFDFSRK